MQLILTNTSKQIHKPFSEIKIGEWFEYERQDLNVKGHTSIGIKIGINTYRSLTNITMATSATDDWLVKPLSRVEINYSF